MARTATINVSIQAAAETVLGQIVANMIAGGTRWAQILPTPANFQEVMNKGAFTATILPYANESPWNPISKQIQYHGCDHFDAPAWDAFYDETTNSFIDNGRANVGSHQFDHTDINPHTGDAYHREYQQGVVTQRVWRKAHGAAANQWTQIAGYIANTNVALGTAWWKSGLSGAGAQGAFLVYDCVLTGNINIYDPLAASWSQLSNVKPSGWNTADEYNALAVYSEAHNCMVFGAGFNNSTRIARLNSNRTISALPDIPFGTWGIQQGPTTACPVTGDILFMHNPTGSPSVNQLWALNPTTGVYTQQTGNRAPPGGIPPVRGNPPSSSNSLSISPTPCSTHGVVIYTVLSLGGGSRSMWVYRHA